jgi:dienelactone hydrolase
MTTIFKPLAMVFAAAVPAVAAAQGTSPTAVDLKAPDGIPLKASYYSPASPGPGLVLLHDCNRSRAAWDAFARAAAGSGFHVLALDYRGFGESGGDRFQAGPEQQAIITEKWPGDVDAALAWLQAQPGVERARIGAAGASCGVNQAVLLAQRHPEVKTVVMLSGGVNPAGRQHLRSSPGLSILAAASHDDGDAVNTMRWVLGWSRNPANKAVEYQKAGHGTDMFAAETTLQPALLEWFDRRLRKAADSPITTAAPDAPGVVEQFWAVLADPDGEARARKMIAEVRASQPAVVLFPEGEMNLYGYQLLQEGNAAHARWVFQLNVDAYPASANTYDSLSDAYLALGKRADALRLAQKALKMLETDTRVGPELRKAIQESAERKIRDLSE